MNSSTEQTNNGFSAMVGKAFQKRKQAQLEALSTLERTINESTREARRAAVRIQTRSQNTQGE
ncbi:MAG: hypothetical protein ABJH28_05170 [Paraglaciecola sp.]|uniref:hypothetical protein n=1 Tax=Paraglaciecola sp. TaxID=1920173 RepID=UPI00326650A3